MQTLFKFRAAQRSFVRFSMGKPSVWQEWELTVPTDQKEKLADEKYIRREKFTPSFQKYLDTRLTLEELMKSEAKPPLVEPERI